MKSFQNNIPGSDEKKSKKENALDIISKSMFNQPSKKSYYWHENPALSLYQASKPNAGNLEDKIPDKTKFWIKTRLQLFLTPKQVVLRQTAVGNNYMKKILLILLIGISNLTFAQTGKNLSGKIVDEKLNCLFGVKITNLNSGTESISDQNGRYEINTMENDTLEFQMIGLTTDKIKMEKPTQTLNLIMMNKDVNCLGAIWTEKQYRKAYRGIEKRLKKLYKTAEKQNVWKNSSCQ